MRLKLKYVVLLVLLFMSFFSVGATPVPTPDQLEMLRSLSSQERQQLMRAMTRQSDTVAKPAKTLPMPEIVKQRPTVQIEQKALDDRKKSPIEKQIDEGLDSPDLRERPEAKVVKQALKQFGYDLFAGSPTTFAPATDIPMPADFIIGPGDTIKLSLFGTQNVEHELLVSREGNLNFPEIGPIPVAGLTFREMKEILQERVKRQFIDVKASISMGQLRSIRVFVLGDAYKPGSYTVSALSTMTNALLVSGGVLPIGSLRKLQLKRRGKVVAQLDLYDLLLRGDTSHDARLQPGDVLFVPPIGRTVGIGGEVRRPAIYEIKTEKTVNDIVKLAGGLLPTAYPDGAQLERLRHSKDRTLIDVDLTEKSGRTKRIQNGDVVRVYSILDKMEDVVLLSGHVQRSGGYQWHPGMRITDLIPSAKDLLPKADVGYVIIKREMQPSRHIRILSADLEAAWWSRGEKVDIRLRPRDEVIIFSINENRGEAMKPVIALLRQQARYGKPEPIVSVFGNVRFPGDYPYEDGMGVAKLVRAAVDVLPMTDMDYALLVREKQYSSHIHTFSVRLSKILQNVANEPLIRLQPRDRFYVFNMQGDRDLQIKDVLAKLNSQASTGQPAKVVSVRGHVRSPGSYPLEKNMRISDLLRAAGDMTEAAYSLDAELTRFEVVDSQIRQTTHIPVNLSSALAGDPAHDLQLSAHDTLTVKLIPAWGEKEFVDIKGEVLFPGQFLISRGEKLSKLIKRAGGLTEWAQPEGAVFRRKNLAKREQEALDKLTANLESELAVAKLREGAPSPDKADALYLSDTLLKQAKETKAVGRLVIDLGAIVEGDKDKDVLLKGGDQLYVPGQTQVVTVLGEVFSPTSHIYDKHLDRDKYINLSGGLTHKADKDKIYVIRANGAVVADSGSWFGEGESSKIKPGDTIVVPLDADRIKPLKLWTDVTQILYQLGIAAASWKTVGIF